jgi:hypothetical protein
MEYARVSPIPISTKRDRTIKTRMPLFMDVVVKMNPIQATTRWAEDIIQEGKEDTPTPMPMVMSAEETIKIKDSRDLCSLLSHLDTTVVVGVEEVIVEEDNTIIIIMVHLHSLLDHQGIEGLHPHLLGHLDITVLLHHHLQDLIHPVDIIDPMDHPHLDLDIISHLLLPDVVISHLRLHHLDAVMNVDHRHLDMDHLPLLDVVISHLLTHHLDVVMGVDLYPHSVLHLLDMDQDNMDSLLSLQDQNTTDPHLLMDIETIEGPGPGVLMEEVIEDRSESTGLVLVHPLLHAGARPMPTLVLTDRSPLDIKGMTM